MFTLAVFTTYLVVPFACVTEFLLALICGLLLVIGYTHTLVRIGVTIVTHTEIVIISPPVLCWSCL